MLIQAYYVIKAAQEREELQREGDILDGHIQTAEREVRGLEATLAKLNVVNVDMGNSFRCSRLILPQMLHKLTDLFCLSITQFCVHAPHLLTCSV